MSSLFAFGNVCRSPMAEGSFESSSRDAMASACHRPASAPDVACQPARGSALSVDGVNLTNFRSQPVSEDLIRQPTHIFVMTRDHKRMIELSFEACEKPIFCVSLSRRTRRA